VSSGSREDREDIILNRKRAHGAVVYNDEPESHVVIHKRKRVHGVVVSEDEPESHVIIKKRHPAAAAVGETSRTVTRSHEGGEVNVRAGVRSRETTTGSATTINRSQSSSSGTSSGSQSGGRSGGNASKRPGGNAPGQGNNP
jgi:hypothetical protein